MLMSYEACCTVERHPGRPAIIAIFGCNLQFAGRRRKESISPFCQLQRRRRKNSRAGAAAAQVLACGHEEGWGQKKEPFLPHKNRSDFPKESNCSAPATKRRLVCVSVLSSPDRLLLCQEITRVTETCYFSGINFPTRGQGTTAYEIRTQFFISGEICNLSRGKTKFHRYLCPSIIPPPPPPPWQSPATH